MEDNQADHQTEEAQSHRAIPQDFPQVGPQATSPAPVPSISDTGGDVGSEAPVNARKRKKSSRACDFCHINHQPCDNGQPKCSVCEKHNKACNYLRPIKRRGPQKGYRTALNTYKESAAAWGAVLGAIPGLDVLIEGHLRSENGRHLLKTIKDPSQQDILIQKWQRSTVFGTFFPTATAGHAASVEGDDADLDDDSQPDVVHGTAAGSKQRVSAPSPSPPLQKTASASQGTSLFDIVANDAARFLSHASQTLAPLGFAPNETIADFYDIGSNPEQISGSNDFDTDLGTDADQRVYYELLMGRSFNPSARIP